MSKSFDVIVAKEYETSKTGSPEKRTAWNRVGRAWYSKSFDSLSFELFLFPGQRYVISMRESKPAQETPNLDEAPF